MLGYLAIILAALYLLDCLWKIGSIAHFFHRVPPPEPRIWPALSLIQPVTSSPNDLRAALIRRAQNPYPGPLEQIIVCDPEDVTSQALCREIIAEFPAWQPRIVLTPAAGISLKTVKQMAGLEHATGEMICFVDDDILLRPETLPTLVRHIQPGVGATFGLACYTNWCTVWGGLMSAFVNANALPNYIPLIYLIEPYTITGHIYALRRADFERIGGLTGMAQRLDDDHELARRVIQAGLRNCQTPALYDVDNQLPGASAFLAQMKRWFIFPRELMLPGVSLRGQIATLAISLPNLLPGLILLVVLFSPFAWPALAISLMAFYSFCIWSELSYLKRPTPGWAWPLFLPVALVLPFHILFLYFSSSTILWRGQKIRVKRGGECEIIE